MMLFFSKKGKSMNIQITRTHTLVSLLFLLTASPIRTEVESPLQPWVDFNTVVATINVGVTPTGIAINHHSNTAYVANNNNYGIAGEDSVSVINLKKNLVKKVIFDESFNQPYTITLSHYRGYVTNSNSTTITVFDTKTNCVVDVIDGFDGPSGMAISPDGKTGYVNNYGGPDGVGSGNGTTVSVVDLQSNTIIDTICVGLAPAALALTPDGKFLYVANYVDGNPNTGTVSVIKTKNNRVVDIINGFSGPFAIAITPNGKYALVTNFGSNNFEPFGTTVSIINLKHNVTVSNISLGIQPAGVAITPNGKLAYVSNYNTLYAGSDFTDLTPGQGTVNIIDIHNKKLVPPTIAVGQSPADIAIAPNGRHAYVTNFTSNTVSVIELPH